MNHKAGACLWIARTVSLTAIGLSLLGCTVDFPMRYEPTTAPRPLDLARKPNIFVDQAEDRTGGEVLIGGGPATGRFTPPIPESLREALVIELGRLEIPIVQSKRQADAVLRAVLTMANYGYRTTAAGADLAMELTFKGPKGEILWQNTVIGKASPGPFRTAFQRALADAMAKIRPLFEDQDVVSKIFGAATTVTAGSSASARPSAPTWTSFPEPRPSSARRPMRS